MKRIGDKIKKYRTDLGMTQQDFASRLGVTGVSVSAYENGTRTPSFDVLIRIADLFGVSVDYLLGREEKRTLDISSLTDEEAALVSGITNVFKRHGESEQ